MAAFRVFRRLAELLDVTVSSPADGEVLTYDTGTSKWKNEAGGGSQPFELLGPFPFTYDMSGAIDGDNAPVMVTLQAGQIILKAFAIVVEAWLEPGSLNIVLGSSAQYAIATYNGVSNTVGRELLPHPGDPMHFLAAVVGTAPLPTDVAAVYYADDIAPTAGASDIYVLVTAAA